MPAEIFAPQSALDELAKVVWTLWNRDLRKAVIEQGGIKIFSGGALVGTVGDTPGGVGLGYVYEGSVTSAAAIAAIHKATLEAHTTDLASQLGSINYLNEQKNLHAATLATHGDELSSQAGSINYLAGIATGHSSAISALQSQVGGLASDLSGLASTVGGLSGLAELITALDNTNRIQNMKLTELENRIDRLDGGGGPINPGA